LQGFEVSNRDLKKTPMRAQAARLERAVCRLKAPANALAPLLGGLDVGTLV
jgi:hypothetical protein